MLHNRMLNDSAKYKGRTMLGFVIHGEVRGEGPHRNGRLSPTTSLSSQDGVSTTLGSIKLMKREDLSYNQILEHQVYL